ncbi:1767_t:CDS:2 [Ambispora gerdemannii]|uniref:NADH dehydrogenase [ubiquinone] 1 beta subcomplex subunit 11, mitochondrial n=1 Tax=Ambispora gerdemannii TaxID=144530 RepID=A0A9N8V2J5_9GLOM|nr:1767_t:CDS:2 [Ambispora gerdemannii]
MSLRIIKAKRASMLFPLTKRVSLALPSYTSFRSGSGGGIHHEPEWNEPSGYLFGEKPLPPGQKRVKEEWENIWVYGFGGSFVIGAILKYYAPDTSLRTWATEEAKKRLEARGELTEDMRRMR